MQFSWSPLKRSFLTNIPVIIVLGMTLAACGGGSSPAATGTASSCVAGSNTKFVPLTKTQNLKVAWSQNALDGAWIQQYPNIKGVFAHNDEMAIGAITALKAAGKKPGTDIKVVSIDGTKDAINLVLAGEEYAVVSSNPRLGPLTFQAIQDYAKGQALPAWIVQPDHVYKLADGSAKAYSPDAF